MSNRIKVYAFTLRLCWRSLCQLNIGDHVFYEGDKWILTQGVHDPYWNMHRLSDDLRKENVHRDTFEKLKSVRNFWHDITFTWKFYSGYWHDIWFHDPSKMRSYP